MSLRIRLFVVVLTCVAGAAVLGAQWTAVASAGTIDEGDLGKIVLNNDGSAEIRSTISSTSAKVRFNVVALPALEPAVDPDAVIGGLVFSMRFRDNGTGARVIATLKRVTLAGFSPEMPQATDVIATIDSDIEPPGNTWQTAFARRATCCLRGSDGLRFLDWGYIVEVQMIKHDSTGNPGIMGVQLYRDET
jgi:hypothetical protein